MKSCFAYLLVALVLLQTFSRELLVVDFALNQAAITARFCVNKARPALHCDGKCYFAKQLKKQQERESKAPNPLKERLEMLPAAFAGQLLACSSPVATSPAQRFRRLGPGYYAAPLGPIFRPPLA